MSPPTGPQAAHHSAKAGLFRTLSFMFAGIMLPMLTLGIELSQHWSAEELFDPLPTPFHAFLIASVPLTNAWLFWSLARNRLRHARAMAFCNAFAIGIALYYALLYLSVSPLGVLLIIWFGLGFLLLAPMLALIATIRLRSRFKRQAAEQQSGKLPHAGWGLALALVMVLLAEAPLTVTNLGLSLAADPDEATQLSGIRLLRVLGNEKILLKLCYERTATRTDLLGLPLKVLAPVSTEQARTVFYRVTGSPYNAFPAPPPKTRRESFFSFDNDRGGEQVGGRSDGVSLADSRLDGSLDANAATGYLEWTMVFKNAASIQNEARGQILLPPGAAVSRLTLWINGEEREAAFGSRGEVRKAYEKIVRQQRDPVLVTTQGKDRVLLQLFPVPAGGEMKVRVGITVPLQMSDLQQARLPLPAFRERNFDIAPNLQHALWVEAKTPLSGPPELKAELKAELKVTSAGEPHYAVRGKLSETRLASGHALITAWRADNPHPVWSVDDKANDGSIVVQQISQQPAWQPHRVVLALDGSRAMREVQKQIAEAVRQFPSHIELALVIATDSRTETANWHHLSPAEAATQISQFHFDGGRDNLAALEQAADWAVAQSDSAVLWVHGPQPLAFAMPSSVQQLHDRRPGQYRLYELEAVPGPNRLLENVDGIISNVDEFVTVAHHGSLRADLAHQFSQWQAEASEVVVQRKRFAMDDNPVNQARLRESLREASRTSSHLVRLWALERVAKLAINPVNRANATEMAQRYQLVTPLTGAVVLETQQDYKAAGLEPVPPGSVPTIPEPETWLPILVVLSMLLWQRKACWQYFVRQPPRRKFRNPVRFERKDGHQ